MSKRKNRASRHFRSKISLAQLGSRFLYSLFDKAFCFPRYGNSTEKLRARLKNNPSSATFSDIRKLLEQEGFELDRVTGSHHIFTKDEITFVVPVHNN